MRIFTGILVSLVMALSVGAERVNAESTEMVKADPMDMILYDSLIALEEFLDDPHWIGL